MSEVIATVMMAALGCAFLGAFWAGICNKRAFDQRQKILSETSDSAILAIKAGDYDYERFYVPFEKVPYNRHVWHLFTFRDPMKLYSDARRDTA